MNLRKLFLSACLSAAFMASALNPLPSDSDVRKGTLPNGLTYYLRHNDTPASQADFFLVMRVGSVNEEESQRGLAHFLEHMCFNGTRHFPGNTLIDYMESLGVKFGANLNAYTSTDETVYNICQVPTARQSALDSCMLVLRDWSNDLTLDGKEIDAERGVIKGEWRQRNGQANSRLLEKALPILYPGSIYGRRMPIGSMDVVENFKHKELRNYYKKWYHPLNQCVVVVGDIDLDYTENLIASMWADVKTPKGAIAFNPPAIPNNDVPIVSVQTDAEQKATSLSLYLKHESLADSLENTIEEVRRDVVKNMVASMLAERLTEVENAENSPIMATAIGDMKFLMSRSQQALLMRTPVKKGRTEEAVATLAAELKRAAKYGFLDTEFERARIDARSEMERTYAARKSTTNTDYARRYVRHYLDGGALASAEQTYKMLKGVISKVTVQDCNDYISSVVSSVGEGVVISAYVPEADKVTPAQLSAAYLSVDMASLVPYEDKAVHGDILESEPQPGVIVSENMLPEFGAKLWTLGNGIKVYLRHSSENPDRVIVEAYSPGGFSQGYDASLAPNYKMANDVLAISATGQYTADNLRRLLVGKDIKTRIAIDNMEETLSAASSPADLEDALRILYLKATDMRKDEAAFSRLIDKTVTRLNDNRDNPTYAMGDSIHAYVYNRHPLGMKLSPAAVKTVDYDKIMNIWRERFGDMSDFSFYITGNFDEDSLRNLVCRYIASLPAAGRKEKPSDINYRYGTTDKARFTMPMQNKQSIAYTFYYAPCEFTLHNRVLSQITGSIIQGKLREDLRERRGWTYGVKTHIGLNVGYNGDDAALAIMPVYIRVAPENATAVFEAVDATVRSMTDAKNISTQEVAKVKEFMAKNFAEAQRDNSFWMSVMRVYDKYGVDMASNYSAVLDSVTPETVAQFARDVFNNAHRMQLEMAPQD